MHIHTDSKQRQSKGSSKGKDSTGGKGSKGGKGNKGSKSGKQSRKGSSRQQNWSDNQEGNNSTGWNRSTNYGGSAHGAPEEVLPNGPSPETELPHLPHPGHLNAAPAEVEAAEALDEAAPGQAQPHSNNDEAVTQPPPDIDVAVDDAGEPTSPAITPDDVNLRGENYSNNPESLCNICNIGFDRTSLVVSSCLPTLHQFLVEAC